MMEEEGSALFHGPTPRIDSHQRIVDGGVAPSDSHGVEEASKKIEEKNVKHFLGEETVA